MPDDLTTRCLAEVERAMNWPALVPMLVERNQQGRTFPRVEDEARWLAYALHATLASRLAQMLAAGTQTAALAGWDARELIQNDVTGAIDAALRAVAAAREAP